MMGGVVALVLDTEKRLTDAEARQRAPAWVQGVVLVTDMPWENDFSKARNRALQVASASGADWALWLDTDMHYSVKYDDLQSVLEETDAVAIQLPERGGRYVKDCLIRLPPRGQYVGLTHEYFDTRGKRITLSWPQFWEDDKTEEQLQHKLKRDKALLEEMLRSDDPPARAYYYLGDTLVNLRRKEQAKNSFMSCAATSEWPEEQAWCCYRIAEIKFLDKEYDDALDWCMRGMSNHNGVSELHWLAGVSSYWMGQHVNAACWAKAAQAIEAEQERGTFQRSGFRYTPAIYEGPHDVLRNAYRCLGVNWLAEVEEDRYKARLEARLRGGD